MKATVMYGAGDVRVETVPDATLSEPTDANRFMTHIAIQESDENGPVTWGDPVSDEQYTAQPTS